MLMINAFAALALIAVLVHMINIVGYVCGKRAMIDIYEKYHLSEISISIFAIGMFGLAYYL